MSLKLAVIAAGKNVSLFYKEQLKYFFGDAIEVSNYSIEDKSVFSPKTEDIFLITTVSFDKNDDVLQFIPKDKKLIIGTVTFKNSIIEELKKYPMNTKALLVNTSVKMSIETITLLYQKGINNIEFLPFYPKCNELDKNIEIAITPGEPQLAPKNIKEIIDIKNRVLDTTTILEIATLIDCEYLLETKRFTDYFEEILDKNVGIEALIETNSLLKQKLKLLTDENNIGIISIDKLNIIINCNKKALEYTETSRTKILLKTIDNLFFKTHIKEAKKDLKKTNFIYTNNSNVVFNVSVIPIVRKGKYSCAFILISKILPNESYILRESSDNFKKSHRGRYIFEDIITKSSHMIKLKEIAMKMSRTCSPVLITGETGTGKELFAHSIHNYSDRKDKPFVAINCAALAENLLESELFGYEEGAFSGAKKGGKIGLFEIANNGTIFLDEIEGMSKNLQIKLLRVTQEKEIIKVGGDRLIPIDVRIIAASNEDLLALVEEKKFRNDLYYRLNTLPINLIPLRNRKEDIELLINNFKTSLNFNFILTEKTQSILMEYNWPGNVRELKNCIEYFFCLNEKIIDISMLPEYIRGQENLNTKKYEKSSEDFLIFNILEIIYEKEKMGLGAGRQIILKELEKKNIDVSEAIIRKILNIMKEKGYIESSRGRGGTKLVNFGKETLMKIK
ncbi:sigma 54-interacting transcriptional regulator [uncultured Cetobacterium sp.]|uniref:sigma 54-interacting transcriptional regulator n=1 Tax=uncultured Cetobacterium sp. TaxID=527638 RepID=UPI0026222FE5|nr:sigma 54-interacting transcriptional regulator [uncultured Cetobacterium sp.]